MRLCFVADANHANAAQWLEYFATELGHEVHSVSLTRVTRTLPGVVLHDLSTTGKLSLLARIPALRRVLGCLQPDLTVAYRVQSYGFMAAATGSRPLVLVAQSEAVVWPPDSRVMAQFCKYAIRRADWILCWADHTRRRLIKLGADPQMIDTFPKGVRPELFRPGDDVRDGATIITTRSLEPEYNHAAIITAISDLRTAVPRLKYVIVGQGSCREALGTLVLRLGLKEHVDFVGYLNTRDVPARLREADVYVSSCYEDGVSASLLEAMACGLLPVVPDTDPNRIWIRDGVNGLLFAPGDHASLVLKLREALTDLALRRRAREHNVRFVAGNVNWHVNMRRIETRFLQLTAGREEAHPTPMAVPPARQTGPQKSI